MKNAPSIQFYPRDYLADADVRMLSYAQRGIYMDLLCFCWERDGLPANHELIRKLLCLSVKEAKSMLPDVMAMFTKTELGYHHERLMKQKELYQDKRDKARESASKRWQSSSNANAYETHMPTHCEGNAIIAVAEAEANAEEKLLDKSVSEPDTAPKEDLSVGFEDWWLSYPNGNDRRQDKQGCLKKWKARKLCRIAPEIIKHTNAMCNSQSWLDGYEPMAKKYLNESRWESAVPTKATSKGSKSFNSRGMCDEYDPAASPDLPLDYVDEKVGF